MAAVVGPGPCRPGTGFVGLDRVSRPLIATVVDSPDPVPKLALARIT